MHSRESSLGILIWSFQTFFGSLIRLKRFVSLSERGAFFSNCFRWIGTICFGIRWIGILCIGIHGIHTLSIDIRCIDILHLSRAAQACNRFTDRLNHRTTKPLDWSTGHSHFSAAAIWITRLPFYIYLLFLLRWRWATMRSIVIKRMKMMLKIGWLLGLH